MAIKAQMLDYGLDRWVDAYIRSITYGQKYITVDINFSGKYIKMTYSVSDFEKEIKITGKRLVKVPKEF